MQEEEVHLLLARRDALGESPWHRERFNSRIGIYLTTDLILAHKVRDTRYHREIRY